MAFHEKQPSIPEVPAQAADFTHVEQFGSREIGSIDELKESTLRHFLSRALELAPQAATHLSVMLPHTKDSGFSPLVDEEGNEIEMDLHIDEQNRRHIHINPKAAIAFAGLSVLAVAAIHIIPKVRDNKKT